MQVFLRRWAEDGRPLSSLVAGTSVRPSTLQDKNERISWEDFSTMMANVGAALDEGELVALGRRYLRSPAVRFIATIARLTFTPMEFYRWMNKARDGAGNQMFTCIVPSHREVGPNEIQLDLTLPPGYPMCWEFFVVSIGAYSEMSALLGLPPAKVRLTRLENGARYHITVPQDRGLVANARRAMMFPLTIAVAGRELKAAHETLQQRFEELEDARAKLDRQATQLRTAHTVSQVVHGEVDLDRTLDAITRALVDDAGFAAVRVDVATEVDGTAIARSKARGHAQGQSFMTQRLGRGGKTIGELRVAPVAESDLTEREELLAFIVPTVSMALDNAISYEALEGYRRGLERRVAERTAELSAARDTLAETVQHLEEARRVRERIFANVNHELRTPLSLILLAAAELRARGDGALRGHDAQSLSAIERGARRLLRMVDELLLLAEGNEKGLRLQLVATDLTELTRGIVDGWAPAARSSEFTLRFEGEPAVLAEVDAVAFDRILSNLLSNAMKFTPPGGSIDVKIGFGGDRRVVLEVSDTGIGIDDELRQRLFGRFERGRGLASAISGSGIGLSLVKSLVEAHAGTIAVEARPQGGTTFRITLPSTERAASQGTSRTVSLVPGDYGLTPNPDARELYECQGTARAVVLLAEDDPLLRDRIAKILSADYRVYAAGDGLHALSLAKRHRPDLLVTDLAMPGLDGIELTKRFVALPGNRVSPVIILTAFGATDDRLAGFHAGAIDYVVKPFEPAELRARVRSQLALRALAVQLMETEKLAALGTLSAGLAHEMRNPANGIVNAVEPLRDALPKDVTAPGTPAGQLLEVIETCAAQIAVVSRQLLGFRRGAALERKPVRFDNLLSRVCATLRPALTGIELREHLAYEGTIPCAEALMTQVLTNLVDNAAYAAGKGGWVEVTSAALPGGRGVAIEIADSGPGVPPEIRERVFEPFFTTKPPGKGTGLGLATARDIIARHGGTLTIRPRASTTVFRIEMPLDPR